jgi:hypothetical protein
MKKDQLTAFKHLKSWRYFLGAVVVVVDLATIGGAEAADTFQVQAVFIANL